MHDALERDSGTLGSPVDVAIELVDAGRGRRLDRFGARLVDRPHPAATTDQRLPGAWSAADLRFDPGTGWTGRGAASGAWTVGLGPLTLELRPTSSGGVGLFPEQLANTGWVAARVRDRSTVGPRVLNLFAHTGLVTLAAADAGAAVTHVDAARNAVDWARRNAVLSGLDSRPIRWLVDDALSFLRREARRGRGYDGIVLDPPSYGHAGARTWHLEDDLATLLAGAAAVLAPGGFMLLTVHTTGSSGEALRAEVAHAFEARSPKLEVLPLELLARSGARLPLGTAIVADAAR